MGPLGLCPETWDQVKDELCLHCGAKLKKYWHRLTPGLVKALAKLYAAICEKGENDININDEMNNRRFELNHSERSNWQKLRLHALVARVRYAGEVQKGRWLITRRGVDFLLGRVSVPVRVQSFRNRVVDHDTQMADLTAVMKGKPYWEREFDYDIFTPKQEGLF